MSRYTQSQRLLNLFKLCRWVSPLDAARLQPPILRFSARVYDLRRQGHQIQRTWCIPRFGRPHWKYELADGLAGNRVQ